uniref:Uncharacterized protein n=1 Tax=Molossus molossus TaxID=27622 RepID=A0A7J8C8S9_MOLMO|nr:hypothetical protein HJG59_009913 [Molossus molossus]
MDFQVILVSLKTYGIFNCTYFLNRQVCLVLPSLPPALLDTGAPATFPCIFPLFGYTFTNTFFFSPLHMGFLSCKWVLCTPGFLCSEVPSDYKQSAATVEEVRDGGSTKAVQLFIYTGSSPQSTGTLRSGLQNRPAATRNKGLMVHSASL